MAKYELRNQALEMRKLGMSYGQIRDLIPVSKSTLSLWLRDQPLSKARINELRANSERRIERCRDTKQRNREARLKQVYEESVSQIGMLTNRELYISGLILYWAEGTKAARGSVYMTNTDPTMLLFFIRWLELMNVPRERIRCRMHLYADMDIEKETKFWAETLALPATSFKKPYIKESNSVKRKNYKGRFGHGTCNIFVYDIALYEKIMMGIKFLGSQGPAAGIS